MATSSLPKELGRIVPERAPLNQSVLTTAAILYPHLRVQIDASSIPGPIAAFWFLHMNSKTGLYA